MIRYNAKGEFNVPYGRYANLNTSLVTKAHSKLLANTEIYNLDYNHIFDMANQDDFLFFANSCKPAPITTVLIDAVA